MANSVNLYLNGVGGNLFTSQVQTVETTDDNAPTVKDTSASAYNPVIETSQDEEGTVQLDSDNTAGDAENAEQENKEENYLKNAVVGSGRMVGETLKAGVGVVGDSAKGLWDSTKTAASGTGQTLVGAGQILVTPFAGLVKGIKTTFNNTAKGIGQILSGQIGKGLGSLVKGAFGVVTESAKWAWKGVKKVAKGVGKIAKAGVNAVKSVGNAVIKGVKNVGKAIGKGLKKIFKGW